MTGPTLKYALDAAGVTSCHASLEFSPSSDCLLALENCILALEKKIKDCFKSLEELFAKPTPNKIHFIHIKQIHDESLRLLQATCKHQFNITFPIELLKRAIVSQKMTARSQLKVAQVILEHPSCPVLDESLDCDIDEDFLEETKTRYFEKIFPGQVLPEFDALNILQIETLNKYGAPRILHALQKITKVYKSVHPEQNRIFLKQAMTGNLKAVVGEKGMSAREKEAIECAKEAAIKHKHFTVLVNYGAFHNFKPHCDEAGFSHEEIDCSSGYNSDAYQKASEKTIKNLKSLVCISNDVGFGNTLGIRSEETSWETTVPFTWTPDGWIGKVPNFKEFKFVVMSQDGTVTWEKTESYSGSNRSILCNGNRIQLSCHFAQQVIGDTILF